MRRYAVRRALCAYHLWECDGAGADNIYPGVCRPTCDDIPARAPPRPPIDSGPTRPGPAREGGGKEK